MFLHHKQKCCNHKSFIFMNSSVVKPKPEVQEVKTFGWSRSRRKVSAPASASGSGSGTETGALYFNFIYHERIIWLKLFIAKLIYVPKSIWFINKIKIHSQLLAAAENKSRSRSGKNSFGSATLISIWRFQTYQKEVFEIN